MQIDRKKSLTFFAFLMIALFIISIFATPSSHAAVDYRTKKTYAVCGLLPNPAGVGQEVLVWLGITDYVENQSMGWHGLTVTVTKPDGSNQTLGPFTTDATGATGTIYIPDTVGNYTFQTHFPAQFFNWSTTPMFDPEIYGKIYYLASDSPPVTLVVQQNPRPNYPETPLPTDFWTRPITAQDSTWYTISGNWLRIPPQRYAPYNDYAPESSHILWTKPLTSGGLSGGFLGVHSAETGDAYEGKFANSVVLNGILFYNRFAQGFGGGWNQQGFYAVDIRTGEELWFKNNSRLAFGQTLYWDSFNMHGVFSYIYDSIAVSLIPGNPFGPTSTTWRAYDPLTGEYEFSISNVPTGGIQFGASFTQTGPNGDIIIYNIDLVHGWLAKWNSTTAVIGPQMPGAMTAGSWGSAANTQQTFNGNRGYDWNKTISAGANSLPGSIVAVTNDTVLGCTAGGFTSIGDNPVGIWAFSMKPGQEGTLLYNTTWQPPTGDLTVSFGDASQDDGVFTLRIKETRTIYGFDLASGKQIWGPTAPEAPLQIYGYSSSISYGKLYSTGYGGVVYAYNVKTGELLWNYTVADPYHQILWSNNWPIFIAFITDGRIYLTHYEHSPVNPLPKGAPMICLDAENGTKLWDLELRTTNWGGGPVIGDSIIALYNSYDEQIYSLGKGPSATTVTAPNIGVPAGSTAVISGAVMDISAGTQQTGVKANFPNGLPAVSDDSQTAWMEYVYMQFERPTDTTGVPVSIDSIDPNGNFIHIGDTISDASGTFSYVWTPPDIPGKYTITATFEGSKAYWSSSAQTAVSVESASQQTGTTTPLPISASESYFVPSVLAIIASIFIVGAVLGVLIIRKGK